MSRLPDTQLSICIAGMHRSGTSMVTQLLGKCGLELGPHGELLPPADANLDGFWENRAFVALNNDILNRLGGSWHHPPRTAVGWEQDERLEDLRTTSVAALQQFPQDRQWGWKDPRNSLTIPFWRSLIPGLRVVICVRRPLDAAASLTKRTSFTMDRCLELWRIYNERALESIPRERRIVTAYEGYFDQSRNELQRVAEWAGLDISPADLQHARDVLLPQLRHHRPGRAEADSDVPSEVRALFARLCAEAEWDPATEPTSDESVIENRRPPLWAEWLRMSGEEVMAHLPPDTSYILIDHRSGLEREIAGRYSVPFLERDGQYWGKPPDDATAIRELERMRTAGVRMVVFTWLAFWWVEHYAAFYRHLETNFRCVIDNQRFRAFDLTLDASQSDRRAGAGKYRSPQIAGDRIRGFTKGTHERDGRRCISFAF